MQNKLMLPIYIRYGDWGMWTTEFTFKILIGKHFIQIPKLLRMGGTHRTTTLMVKFSNNKEISICWRLDVSIDYWLGRNVLLKYRRFTE